MVFARGSPVTLWSPRTHDRSLRVIRHSPNRSSRKLNKCQDDPSTPEEAWIMDHDRRTVPGRSMTRGLKSTPHRPAWPKSDISGLPSCVPRATNETLTIIHRLDRLPRPVHVPWPAWLVRIGDFSHPACLLSRDCHDIDPWPELPEAIRAVIPGSSQGHFEATGRDSPPSRPRATASLFPEFSEVFYSY